MKVLVIDDSAVMRMLIKRDLKKSGADIESFLDAPDGAVALEILQDTSVDMIFCDVNMPNMSGDAFVKKKMEDERLKSIPVVMVSTDSTRDLVSSLVGNGVVGFVEKPFRPEDLHKEVNRILAGSSGLSESAT